MRVLLLLLLISNSWGATPDPEAYEPINCECSPVPFAKSCGTSPAFMSQNEIEIARALGFDVAGDNVYMAGTVKGLALYTALASFLDKSDRARMFYPAYYTRSAKDVSVLTLNSTYIPKNPTETDEYFRCTIPPEKYCLYRKSLRPYIGFAAKSSGFAFSFLACQAYVESRFSSDAESSTGAKGYSQVQPDNIEYLNQVLRQSIRTTSKQQRGLAGAPANTKDAHIIQVQKDIAALWTEFWKGTKKAPKRICENDLICHRQAFLVQSLALKTDMLAFATSSRIKADFDEAGDFRIENMDKGDSLLLLAGSYNLGVTKMIKLISEFCSGSTKLKDCIDKMKDGVIAQQKKSRYKDVGAVINYIMRIRDCSQQFSAEQIDFDDDGRWTHAERTEMQNKQRDDTVTCLLHPCPFERK